MTKDEILSAIRVAYEQTLGENLVGIYVHGSIAFGCFDPRVSDIDFLVVVREPLTITVKKALIVPLLTLEPQCPKKGVEMSIVLSRNCKPFVYPTPYELHYSASYSERAHRDLEEYCANLHGTDKDLAAHFTVTRAVGQVLCGAPIDEVFGDVPRETYLDSLRYDIENAVEDIREYPVYIILNLCRVAAYLHDGAVLSKKDGGAWGLNHLPHRYHPVICAALQAYTTAAPYVGNADLEHDFAALLCSELL